MYLPYCIYSLMNGDAFRCEDNQSPPPYSVYSHVGQLHAACPQDMLRVTASCPCVEDGWMTGSQNCCILLLIVMGAGIAQSVWWLTGLEAAWTSNRGSVLGRIERFLSFQSVCTGSGAHAASCTVRTRSFFPGGNAAWAWSWLLIPN